MLGKIGKMSEKNVKCWEMLGKVGTELGKNVGKIEGKQYNLEKIIKIKEIWYLKN